MLGPAAGRLPFLPFFIAPSGKGKRKDRNSGRPGAGRGNSSSHMPHEGRQERLRRVIGGFHRAHYAGFNKRSLIAHCEKQAAAGKRYVEVPPMWRHIREAA